jgi:hypothetical protein
MAHVILLIQRLDVFALIKLALVIFIQCPSPFAGCDDLIPSSSSKVLRFAVTGKGGFVVVAAFIFDGYTKPGATAFPALEERCLFNLLLLRQYTAILRCLCRLVVVQF